MPTQVAAATAGGGPGATAHSPNNHNGGSPTTSKKSLYWISQLVLAVFYTHSMDIFCFFSFLTYDWDDLYFLSIYNTHFFSFPTFVFSSLLFFYFCSCHASCTLHRSFSLFLLKKWFLVMPWTKMRDSVGFLDVDVPSPLVIWTSSACMALFVCCAFFSLSRLAILAMLSSWVSLRLTILCLSTYSPSSLFLILISTPSLF